MIREGLQRLAARHAELFGRRPERFFSAPGRTELSGNHTDHNHGRVLAAAVELDALAAVHALPEPRVLMHSEGFDGRFEVDLAGREPRPAELGRTEALIRGIAAGFAERGRPVGGFAATVSSRVARGSGLSSSAAIEVLLGTIFNRLYCGGALEPLEIAKIGQAAENRFFGKPCGLMDQTASALGGIVAIDFEDPGRPRIEKLSFDFSAAGWALTVVDSGGSHADLTGDYAAIPEEMKAVAAFFGRPTLRGLSADELLARVSEVRMAAGDRAVMRALHYFEENERVVRQAAALEAGDLDGYLELVQASGQSSWKLLQNCSPAGARREQALALALSLSEKWLAGRGVCRVHGGGFAGTIQAYVPLGLLADYGRRMRGVFGPDCLRELRIRQPGALEIAPE